MRTEERVSKKYYVIISWNGFKWLFPKDESSFMTIKELEDISLGIVPEKWRANVR